MRGYNLTGYLIFNIFLGHVIQKLRDGKFFVGVSQRLNRVYNSHGRKCSEKPQKPSSCVTKVLFNKDNVINIIAFFVLIHCFVVMDNSLSKLPRKIQISSCFSFNCVRIERNRVRQSRKITKKES